MTEMCGKCKSTKIFSGSWTPSRCLNCGAGESYSGSWYYDATAQPSIAEIRKRSGYKAKPKRKKRKTPSPKEIVVEQVEQITKEPFDEGLMLLKGLMYLVLGLASMGVIGVFAGLGDYLFEGVGAVIGICVGCCLVVFIWRKLNVSSNHW